MLQLRGSLWVLGTPAARGAWQGRGPAAVRSVVHL